MNAELVTLTYGTIVAQLCQDYDNDYREVNKQLDKMGYNIGMRLIEDYLAKSTMGRCANFRETGEIIAKVRTAVPGTYLRDIYIYLIIAHCCHELMLINTLARAQVGFKIFLNISPTVTNWTSDNNQFSLVFDENPLADFVELPDDGRAQDELWYSTILCGVLRGALEMVGTQSWEVLVLASRVCLIMISGTNANRSSFCQRRFAGRRYDGDACVVDTVYRGRAASGRRVKLEYLHY